MDEHIPSEPIEKIILRSMIEGVITLECNGHIFFMNPAARTILDLSEDEFSDKPYQEVFSHENTDFKEIFDKVIQQDLTTYQREIPYMRKDGQRIHLSVSSSFLEIDACSPEIQNIVIVFRDVTAIKALERARRKAVDHLSHELNTPLAVIQASVRQIAQQNIDPEKLERNVARIERNLKRLQDLQEVAQQIVTPFPVQPAPLDEAFLRNVVDDIRTGANHRKLNFIIEIPQFRVDYLDPHLVSVIMRTLIKNAIENTPDGGQVTIHFEEAQRRAIMRIQDNGVGIRLEDQEFIFEGFHHTQDTEEYSTKKPFDFNAGGKGLELMQLKMLSEQGVFDLHFESRRCKFIPSSHDHCPGLISACPHVQSEAECDESGGTLFTVVLHPVTSS
jgi:PAS domain S-box-containing protein